MDRELITRKLTALKEQIPHLKEAGHAARKTAAFANWHDDIGRWLSAGRGFTQREHLRFCNTRFSINGYTYSESLSEERFDDGLDQTAHLIGQAIENLERGISFSEEPTPQPDPAPLVTVRNEISNANVLFNLNLHQMLEGAAIEIEKKDPVEGGRFRDTLKSWMDNPMLREVLKMGGEVILRHYGGGGGGAGPISV
jgi:hypothetical protein